MPRVRIREAIRTLLTADAALTAIVGSRIWSERRPPSGADYPCLVFRRERAKPLQGMQGNLQGYTQASYDFLCFGNSQEVCEDIRDCVLRLLPSAGRSVSVSRGGSVVLGGIATDDDQDVWVDDPEEDPELWQYMVRLHVDYEEDLS